METKFIGQKKVQKQLDEYFKSIAQGNNIHLMVLAPSGYGKTAMTEFYVRKHIKNYSISIPDKIIKISQVTIIDEAHTLQNPERFYPIMDKKLYSFVFCTNIADSIPDALITRTVQIYFENYTEEEIGGIFRTHFPKLSKEFATSLAEKFLLNPRITHETANKLVYYKKKKVLSEKEIEEALKELGYNVFDPPTETYVRTLLEIGKPVSEHMIKRAIPVPHALVKNYIEPFLFRYGYLEITSKGRVLTAKLKEKYK